METTSEQPRLRIVTFGDPEPETVQVSGSSSCTDDYLCTCPQHAEELERRVKQGVRPRQPIPRKRAA